MDAETFDHHAAACPICHRLDRASGVQSLNMVNGLLTCPRCRTKLVISVSGHYVRDPFMIKPSVTGKTLRRQSRPLARILRDAGVYKHSSVLAMLGSLVVLGASLTVFGSLGNQRLPLQNVIDQILNLGELPNQSP